MSHFERAFVDLLGNEGKYSNDPDDPGGETMWGVTVAVARENGYVGAMVEMDSSVARTIYAKRYWISAFDQLPYAVAFQVFDGAVNSSVGQSVRWLQRTVGAADDGKLGSMTLQAVQAADPLKVVLLFNAERLAFMTKLKNWPNHGRGWANRIANNLKKGAA